MPRHPAAAHPRDQPPPTSGQKAGAFGVTVLDGFRLLGGKVPEAAVKTALRTFIAGLRKAEQTGSSEPA